jgi:hypothetical protein
MDCPHSWNMLTPSGKLGFAHCRECGEDIKCSHPRPLKSVGNKITYCLGCTEILELDICTSLVVSST